VDALGILGHWRFLRGIGHIWPKIKAGAPTFLRKAVPAVAEDGRVWILLLVVVFL
jgi:hypothetical protein